MKYKIKGEIMKRVLLALIFSTVLFSCGDSETETKIKEAEEKRIENDKANRSREYQKPTSSDEILKEIQK